MIMIMIVVVIIIIITKHKQTKRATEREGDLGSSPDGEEAAVDGAEVGHCLRVLGPPLLGT